MDHSNPTTGAALVRAALPATLLAALLVGACGDEGVPPPSVVVVSLDTVRADLWAAAPTPHFDRFAARADRYTRATSTAPWTVPSHASMFTGRYPDEHGAVSFDVDRLVDNAHPLHPSHVTLAEELAEAGYRTAGFVANTVYLSPRHGLDQGFDDWFVRRARGDELTSRALEWVDANRGDERPFFLFLNYLDAHRPYNAQPRAGGRQSVAALAELIERVMVDGQEPGALAGEVREFYTEALTNLDAALGALLDGLDERGLLDGALVIVTSDHGEAFGEHGLVEHSKGVIEPLLRVPFVVKRPGQSSGAESDERASSVHVPGLVARATGVGAERFPRVPTSSARAANRYSRPHDLLRFGDRFRRIERVLYDGDLKLVAPSDGAPRLYDVRSDPAEEEDLARARPEDVARMSALLEAPTEYGPWPGPWLHPDAPSAEAAAEMRALGYAGVEPR